MYKFTIFIIIFLRLTIYTCASFDNYIDFVKQFNLTETDECRKHFLAALNSDAIIRMFDASTKILDGMLNGRVYHLGAYDECINTQYVVKISIHNKTYNAKYCLKANPPGLRTAVCLPNACTLDERATGTEEMGFNKFLKNYCYEKNDNINLSTEAVITLIFLGCSFGIVVISTILDIYFQWKQRGSTAFVRSFSAYTNGQKILKTQSLNDNSNELSCLYGIRTISIMWVILGHLYFVSIYSVPLNNGIAAIKWLDDPINMIIIGATVSVDTFLAISGLLTVYIFLKTQDANIKFNIFYYYLYRYLRLTPALAVVILFHATLAQYVGDGPLWGVVQDHLSVPCRKYWWTDLLYIQNYALDMSDLCLLHSWYLSVDTQLFVLAPIILLALKYRPIMAILMLMFLSVVGIIVPFWLGMAKELHPLPFETKELNDMYNLYYEQTHARFASYTIGMIFGYIIYKTRNNQIKFELHLHEIVILWCITLGGLAACTFAGHSLINTDYQRFTSSLYLAINRPAWTFCVCLCIFLCVCNYGGLINKFLSLPIFQIIAKLSYSIYLTHYGIIIMIYASQRVEVEFSNFDMMTRFWGTFMVILAASTVLCLTFESPIIHLSKWFFNRLEKHNNDRVY